LAGRFSEQRGVASQKLMHAPFLNAKAQRRKEPAEGFKARKHSQ